MHPRDKKNVSEFLGIDVSSMNTDDLIQKCKDKIISMGGEFTKKEQFNVLYIGDKIIKDMNESTFIFWCVESLLDIKQRSPN